MRKRAVTIVIISLVISLIIISLTAFGKKGFLTLLQLNDRKERLVSEIDSLIGENEHFKGELIKFKRVDYQELLIRAQLGMAKDGEIIYIFTTK